MSKLNEVPTDEPFNMHDHGMLISVGSQVNKDGEHPTDFAVYGDMWKVGSCLLSKMTRYPELAEMICTVAANYAQELPPDTVMKKHFEDTKEKAKNNRGKKR